MSGLQQQRNRSQSVLQRFPAWLIITACIVLAASIVSVPVIGLAIESRRKAQWRDKADDVKARTKTAREAMSHANEVATREHQAIAAERKGIVAQHQRLTKERIEERVKDFTEQHSRLRRERASLQSDLVRLRSDLLTPTQDSVVRSSQIETKEALLRELDAELGASFEAKINDLILTTRAQQASSLPIAAIESWDLVRVVDGDTIVARAKRGEEIIGLKVRMYGIDAPESDTPEGLAATKALESAIMGRTVRLEFATARDVATDRFGRSLAYVDVWVHSTYGLGFSCLNAELIKNGHARYLPDYAIPRYAAYFEACGEYKHASIVEQDFYSQP